MQYFRDPEYVGNHTPPLYFSQAAWMPHQLHSHSQLGMHESSTEWTNSPKHKPIVRKGVMHPLFFFL